MNPRPYFAILAATTAMAAVPPALSAWRAERGESEKTCVDEVALAGAITAIDFDDDATADDDSVDRVFRTGE